MTFGRTARALLPVLVGLIGAWVAMLATPAATTRMGPFTVAVAPGFGAGETVMGLPPLGEVRFDTHDSPLSVRASLIDIDLEDLASDLRSRSTAAIAADVESQARAAIRPFGARLLGVATLGGALAGAITFRRRWRRVIASAAAALLLVAGAQALAWRTFEPNAFAEPRFEGTLALAPQLLGPVRNIGETIDAFRQNVERIVRGAIDAYSTLEPQTVGSSDEIRILHVSDIHLNTLGIDFAVGVAEGFDVDVVLDTGDLTSYGTPWEESIVPQLRRFGRPYVLVRGNHDPPGVAERIAETSDVRSLEGEVETVKGVRIYGEPHPVFTEDSRAEVDSDAIADGARRAASRLRGAMADLEDVPHIVAVHDDRMAAQLSGRVPLVLSGHFHDAQLNTIDGTVYLRAGSTGGAGVNMFGRNGPVPLSATVLYLDPRDGMRLTAYDLVEQYPTTGRLTIQRAIVPGDESPALTPQSDAER